VTTDESGQLSELTPATASELSENTLPVGASSAPPDVDERPIGACHLEMLEIKAAVAAMRAAKARLEAASAAFWACRDAAKKTAGIVPAAQYRTPFLAFAFESIESRITDLENLIAASTQTTQEVS